MDRCNIKLRKKKGGRVSFRAYIRIYIAEAAIGLTPSFQELGAL